MLTRILWNGMRHTWSVWWELSRQVFRSGSHVLSSFGTRLHFVDLCLNLFCLCIWLSSASESSVPMLKTEVTFAWATCSIMLLAEVQAAFASCCSCDGNAISCQWRLCRNHLLSMWHQATCTSSRTYDQQCHALSASWCHWTAMECIVLVYCL